MKKIIAIMLLCSLLLVCLSGCVIPDNKGNGQNPVSEGEDTNLISEEKDTNPVNEGKEPAMKLNEVFDIIRTDASKKNKFGFNVENEQIYYELKNSGAYDNSNWMESGFIVNIECNYDYAVNEDWYKRCSETDIKSLNQAFYNHYSSGVSNGEYSNIFFAPGMYLMYSSLDSFYSDYIAIKALVDLHFVTEVSIVYYYGLPRDYMKE